MKVLAVLWFMACCFYLCLITKDRTSAEKAARTSVLIDGYQDNETDNRDNVNETCTHLDLLANCVVPVKL